jgi:hypothetical protein
MLAAYGKKVRRSKSWDYVIHGDSWKNKIHLMVTATLKKSVCALQNGRVNTKFPRGSILQFSVKIK